EGSGRAFGELRDQMVERAPALHGSVRQAHGEAAVAWVERARLGLKRAVGVGAALEAAAHYGVGAAPRRRYRGRGPLGHAGNDRYPLRLKPAGARTSARSAASRSASGPVSVAVVTRIPA